MRKRKCNPERVRELQTELTSRVAQAKESYFVNYLSVFLREDPEKFWRYPWANKNNPVEKKL